MTARKTTSKKSASSKKKTAKKSSAKTKTKKKASAKKSAAKKKSSAKKKATAKKAAPKTKTAAKKTTPAKAKPKSGVSSMQVVMGHVFSLRPRANKGFKPDDFRRARQSLADEIYSNIHDAARAVAEKAIEFTRDGPAGAPKSKRF